MMTSVTKEREDYEYLASSLHRKGITSLIYGTDGELALEQGFEKVFPVSSGTQFSRKSDNIHLRCFTHVESDIKAKLQQLKVSGMEQKRICSEILGGEKDGRRIKGLVDCESEESLESTLCLMKLKWPAEFSKWFFSTKGRMRPLADTLKVCMLKHIRVSAGLGNPPNKWHNQGTEALHQVMKEEVNGEAVDQATIHENVNSRVVVQQHNEFVKALYGMGEYRLTPEYASVGVDTLRWSQMTHAQRSAYVKKVLGGGIIDEKCADEAVLKKLSVSIAESGLPKQLAAQVLADMWRKAEIILAQFQIIPLTNGNVCVTESDKAFTVENRKGKLQCKNCATSVATGGLCQHSVAAAETQGALKQHIQHYRQQSGLESRLAFDNAPKGAGAKQRQKKPRRGRNNVDQHPILTEADPNEVSDPDLDLFKPCRFTEVYHNDEPFRVVFVKDFKTAKACEQCKVNFSRTMPIAPWDICIMHEERYMYPVKDPNDASKVLRYTPTRKKKAKRFYCPRKDCLIERHPYFWKGRLEVKERLHASHKVELLKSLRFKV